MRAPARHPPPQAPNSRGFPPRLREVVPQHVARDGDGIQPLLGAEAGDPHGLRWRKDLQVEALSVQLRQVLMHLERPCSGGSFLSSTWSYMQPGQTHRNCGFMPGVDGIIPSAFQPGSRFQRRFGSGSCHFQSRFGLGAKLGGVRREAVPDLYSILA